MSQPLPKFSVDHLVWGEDLIDAGKNDFDTDGDKFSWQINDSNIWDVSNSILKVTYVDGDEGMRIIFSDAMDLTTDLVPGDKYRVKVRYRTNNPCQFIIYRGFGQDTYDSPMLVSQRWAWLFIEWPCSSAIGNDLRMVNFGTGDIIEIDKYIVQKRLLP